MRGWKNPVPADFADELKFINWAYADTSMKTSTPSPFCAALAGCFALAISTPCHGLSYVAEVLADNPAAYWRLDEASGTTAVSSISAPAQNGTYTGGFVLGQTGALDTDLDPAVGFSVNGAFQTSGTTGTALFSGVPSITVELWIKPNSNQSDIHYLEYGLSGFSLESTSLNPTFYVNNVGLGSVPLSLGAYTHVALQIDGSNARIFTNGSLSSTTPFGSSINPDGTAGGALFLASRFASGRFVNADIDELAVYHSALSPSRIQAHYIAATVAVPEPMTTSLVTAALLVAGSVARRLHRKRA